MPLPLAMMIPFMGIQSMVMAKQFGENFQYGKRRISAMSNEEFNKLTPAKLLSNANAELKSQIPLMQESMQDMRNFQTFIVKEFLLTIRSIIDAGLGKLIGLTPTEINETVQNIEHFLHGHFEGHEGTISPPPGDEPPPPPPTGLRSLTLSEVSALSDSTLLQFIQAIQEFDAQTQQFLINERERRGTTGDVVPPSDEQKTTSLPPDFVKTLTQNDLIKGGARTRNYKGTIMKWFGSGRVTRQHTGAKHQRYQWQSNKWVQISAGKATQVQFYNKVNKWKLEESASYVLEFGAPNSQIYFIRDNF